MCSGTVPEELTLREQHMSRFAVVVQNRKSLELWTLQKLQEAEGQPLTSQTPEMLLDTSLCN